MTINIQNTILEIINHLVKKHPEFSPLIKQLLELNLDDKEFIPKFTDVISSNHSRNEIYDYMENFFHNQAPDFIRSHRNYFKINNRGFGEDSFHAMWIMLINQFKPIKLLEIGIYRGQTITLWGLISKFIGHDIDVHGISPFSSIGDRNSTYLSDLDYLEDTLLSHKHFNLTEPKLLKALSNDPHAINYIKSKKWDLIYIDGSHDYEIALSDYEVSVENLVEGGLLVMDDSSLYTDYIPSNRSFKGHPGPSRIVSERAMNELLFLGGVGHNNVFIKR